MWTACINAPIPAVFEKRPRETQYILNNFSVTVWAEMQVEQLHPRRTPLLQKVACEVSDLRTIVESVCYTESFEITIEPVEERNPVV
jgi:hypothetical protein